MICEDCGETNKPGTEFCMFCGAYLGWQAEPNPPGANEVTQPLDPVPTKPPAQSDPASQPAPAPATPTQTAPAQVQAAEIQAAQIQAAPAQTAPTQAPGRPTPTVSIRQQSITPATPHPATPHPAAPATQARADPTPTIVAPVDTVETAAPVCPACARPVDRGRRFCAHCGHQLVLPGTPGAAAARQPATHETWWTRLWDGKDRVARRQFRRSLPPLYRWRRVIIIVLSVGLLAGALTVLHHSPKSFVMARYYDIKKRVVTVEPVNARTIPAGASAGGTDPSALTDNTKGAWLTTWTDKTVGSPCGSPQTTPVIELWFDPIRVRELEVWPGLAKENKNRLLQYRPKDIWIAYGSTCVDATVQNVESQKIPLDTKVPVSSIRIGLKTAWPPDQTPAQNVLGFSEIRVNARPRT